VRIKARLGALVVGASLWAASAAPGLAADSGAVSAQVTVAAPCITVSTTAIDFGAQSLSTIAVKDLTYANCGPVDEKIYGRATNASGNSASWTLDPAFVGGASCGSGSPINKYALNSYQNNNNSASGFTMLSTTDQLIETIAGGATGSRDRVVITMPCAGSSGVGQTMSFTLTFTATY